MRSLTLYRNIRISWACVKPENNIESTVSDADRGRENCEDICFYFVAHLYHMEEWHIPAFKIALVFMQGFFFRCRLSLGNNCHSQHTVLFCFFIFLVNCPCRLVLRPICCLVTLLTQMSYSSFTMTD